MTNNKPKFIAAFMLATCALSTSASAQKAHFKLAKENAEQSNSYNKAQPLLKAQQTINKSRPTAMQQRVISQVSFDENEIAMDSTAYKYSETRGSAFNYYYIDFSYDYEHSFSPVLPSSAALMTNSRMSTTADTIKQYDDINTSDFSYSVGYYRADNQLDSIIVGFSSNASMTEYSITKNTFNAAGLLETSTQNDIGNATDYTITKYFYNTAATQLEKDSTFYVSGGIMSLDKVTAYKYDANERIDSVLTYAPMSANSVELIDFTALGYYPNGKILSINTYLIDQLGTNFLIAQSDTFTHFTNFDAYETMQSYIYDEDGLTNAFSFQTTLGSNGYPDTVKAVIVFYDPNMLFDITLSIAVAFDYNTYNNPISIKQYYDDDPLEYGMRFKYQEYDDSPTSIKPIVNNSFEVFPNPIKDQININNKSELTGKYSISLMDISGRMVFERQQTISAGQNIISIPQIAKGIYLLELKNDKGTQFSQKVVKE